MIETSSVHDCIVVGSGPAGYTAAIYLARAGLSPFVFEGEVLVGGALMNTTDVENFPGFPEGVQGPELMGKLREQAERFGAVLLPEEVIGLGLHSDPKVVETADATYAARAVVLATGSRYRELGVPGETRLSGRGVSWCATCDGFFFRGLDVIVAGGGDSALEEAIFLTRFASSVTIVHRRDRLRASRIMQDRAFANDKIRFEWNSVIQSANGQDRLESVTIRNLADGSQVAIPAAGLFVAIGHEPRSELVKGQLDLDDHGYVLVEGRSTATNAGGVFACGDVVDSSYRQAITAAGSGCAAAIDTERWLAGRD